MWEKTKTVLWNLFSKKRGLKLSVILSLCMGGLLGGIGNCLIQQLDTQRVAEKWSNKKDAAQLTCFFSQGAAMSEDALTIFGYELTKALQEASIESESENATARLWIDAYSASGKVNLESGKNQVSLNALGVAKDFFYFHNVELLSGSCFSGSDVMQDYVMIDQDTAWQLFGSFDVAGQSINLGGIPHIIKGVYQRESGRLQEAAGLSSPLALVSYDSLTKYGQCYGINCYEIVMPNPVSGYALKYLKEKIGVDDADVDIIENSTRFQLLNRLKRLGGFFTRSMNGKAIIYPYWENMVRGYEEILGVILFFEILCLLYAGLLFAIFMIIFLRHKKFDNNTNLKGKNKIWKITIKDKKRKKNSI